MFLKLILLGLGLFLASSLYRLGTNYSAARRIGLPIVVCPATWQNPLWLIVVTVFPIRRVLSIPGLRWARYSYLGWVLYETHQPHDRLGPAFTIVSPAKNEIIIADPHLISETMSKYKKWLKPRELYAVFSLLGENVNSVPAEDWQRHRKIMKAGFAEGNMSIVWNSAVKQAGQWLKEQTIDLKQLSHDTDTISANVLMRAGFGKDYDFGEKGLKDVKDGHKKSFAEAMHFMSTNFLFAWGVKDIRLPAPIQPRKIKNLHDSITELKAYFGGILDTQSGEFVKALLDANENENADGRSFLNRDELYGNLFMLQLAGYDTTSYAMSYTLALLSVHPKIQDWVREEIISLEYHDAYSKAIRCRAALLETMRLFTAAPSLPRYSVNPEILRVSGKDHVVPPNTIVSSNFAAAHTDPKIWGDDAGQWKPQRFINVIDGAETLHERFELMAWSAGPRNCPGKKFSQVETVAAISTVLKDYRLEGTANVEGCLRDFEVELTPKPVRPRDASIQFVKM